MRTELIVEFIFTLLAVGVITVLLLKKIIPILKSHKIGQVVYDIGPRWHKDKNGTPTMGGIGFIIAGLSVTLLIVIVSLIRGNASELIPLAFSLGLATANGMIGFLDDYRKLVKKQNEGLKAWQKFSLQTVVAGIYLFAMKITGNLPMTLEIPFVKYTIEFEGAWQILYYAIALLLVTGIVNAVNLTDGIDGLAATVTAIVGAFFAVMSIYTLSRPLEILSAVVIGGTVGFLFYNWHPARVFMGDTGSLFLGGAVVGAAFMMQKPLVIVIAGLVYVIEAFSDIIQVGVFKLSGRKIRVFKMAPIHHHFEKCGWGEVKVVIVFSIATLIFSVLAFFSI